MGTPHNEAAQGAFAKTVLMPGDPLRAKFIAEHFLDGAKLVNNVRGVQGYTGTYRDTPVSVMASGMGMPSMGIYSYELFHTYDVDNIIRVGSVGSISPRLKLRDVVLGQAACTDSNYPRQYGLDGTFSPIADFTLLESAVSAAHRLGVETAVGNLLSSDVFYRRTEDTLAWGRLGVLAVEMESAALYCNAAEAGKRALAVCTVSDNLLTGEALSTWRWPWTWPPGARERAWKEPPIGAALSTRNNKGGHNPCGSCPPLIWWTIQDLNCNLTIFVSK